MASFAIFIFKTSEDLLQLTFLNERCFAEGKAEKLRGQLRCQQRPQEFPQRPKSLHLPTTGEAIEQQNGPTKDISSNLFTAIENGFKGSRTNLLGYKSRTPA